MRKLIPASSLFRTFSKPKLSSFKFQIAKETQLKFVFSTTTITNMSSIQEIKDQYLKMHIDEKRKLYACGQGFCDLDQIQTWPCYIVTKDLQRPARREGKHKVDKEINEKVSLWKGDITKLEIDVIVNAANSSLLGGGGVDGAIHQAAGPDLVKECRTLRGCPAGMAKITGGYKLPAKYIIHTVGPKGEYSSVLKSCYESSFNLMVENSLKSIAFPCIATGIYGYPNHSAAEVGLCAARNFMEQHKDKVDRVIFTTFLPVDVDVYEDLMQDYFPL